MPIYTVGSGGDFSNLAAWESAVAASATSSDIEIAEILDGVYDATSLAATIGSVAWASNTSAIIRAQNPHLADLTVSSQGVKVNCNEAFLSIRVNNCPTYLSIENIVIDRESGGFYVRPIFIDSNLTSSNKILEVKSCIGRGFQPGTPGPGDIEDAFIITEFSVGFPYTNFYTINIYNCIFSDSKLILCGAYESGPIINVKGTIAGCTFTDQSIIEHRLFRSDTNAEFLVVGNLFDSTSVFTSGSTPIQGTLNCSSINNIYADASSTISFYISSYSDGDSYSTVFVDGTPGDGQVGFTNSTAYDFSLVDDSNNIAKDYVTLGYMPSVDILGNPRDSTPDAGAFEIQKYSPPTDQPMNASYNLYLGISIFDF